ncbi:MAG: hypothetical protein U0945_14180 [Flavobacterium sp.]|nr:hypothetical protein [Flavobacterium sp.]
MTLFETYQDELRVVRAEELESIRNTIISLIHQLKQKDYEIDILNSLIIKEVEPETKRVKLVYWNKEVKTNG